MSSPPVVPFVIFFLGRSGSTYLVEALDSHPFVVAGFEELHTVRKRGGSASDQLECARDFLAPRPAATYHAIGFKTKLHDVLDRGGFRALLGELDARVIVLQRRNAIKWVVSWFNSERLFGLTGDWNLYSSDGRLPPFELDLAMFEERLHEFREGGRFLAEYVHELERPSLWLYYEDLLVDEERALELAQTFLGVEPMRLRGRALKNTPDDLRAIVSNFDELRARYAGTRYEPMFDEVLVDEVQPASVD